MELPDIPKILSKSSRLFEFNGDPSDISYFVSRLQPVATDLPGMALWREKLFGVMLRNAAQASDFYQIPSEDVIELHMKIDI